MSSSKGMPPSSFHQAMRVPLKLRASGARKRAPSSAIDSGLFGSGPAIALRNRARSATDRAIGPDTDSGDHELESEGTRPGDGRKPTMLQNAAGLRSDPPVSLPSAIGTIPHARSEEHTSELQSQSNLVCRLLLEKKKQNVLASHRTGYH